MNSRLGAVLAGVAALLVGALVSVATSDGGTTAQAPPDPGDSNLIAHSVDVVQEAGTYRAEFTMGVEAAGERLGFEGEGEFDEPGRRGRMTMRTGSDVPAELGDFEMEMVLVDTAMYMRSPMFDQVPQISTPWVSMDLEQAGGVDPFSGGGTTDPARTLDYLRGVSGDLTEVGQAEVRGVPTLHYRATVDLERALAELPADDRAALEPAIEQTREMLSGSEFPVEVWIDGDGLPRRMEYALDVTVPGAGQSSMSFSMELFDFGTAVAVEPPPPGDVTDLTGELLSGLPM